MTLFSKITINHRFQLAIFLLLIHYPLLLISCRYFPDRFRSDCDIDLQLDPKRDITIGPHGLITINISPRSCDDKPLTGLNQDNLQIFEDGKPFSSDEGDAEIVVDAQSYQFDTLLLLDMSRSIINSEDIPQLQDAIRGYVRSLAPETRLAIYAFDGRPGFQIEKLVNFTSNKTLLEEAVNDLDQFSPVDRSTNLFGAVDEALSILEAKLADEKDGLYAVSLVVFTDGTHQAGFGDPGYPQEEDVLNRIKELGIGIITIRLGNEIDEDELKRIQTNGFLRVDKADELPDAFTTLRDLALSDYTIFICSPKRSGTYELKIQLKANGQEGEFNLPDVPATRENQNCMISISPSP